jgi:hypothetical protein
MIINRFEKVEASWVASATDHRFELSTNFVGDIMFGTSAGGSQRVKW